MVVVWGEGRFDDTTKERQGFTGIGPPPLQKTGPGGVGSIPHRPREEGGKNQQTSANPVFPPDQQQAFFGVLISERSLEIELENGKASDLILLYSRGSKGN